MKLESPAFKHNQQIPAKYTCDGEDMNPPLVISDVPKGTQSLTLIVDDPDAPKGLWVHWTVWNIAPDMKEISENSVPEGAVEGATDFDKPGYGGPCPPFGAHRYSFRLYAVDTALELEAGTDKTDLEAAMVSHVLASAELIGLYSRGGNK
jgi:Raf kinase inhibitor-like YbhB/YbcL family protein